MLPNSSPTDDSVPVPTVQRLRIGRWTVEPALNQLSCAGQNVKLEPKTMAVLFYLAQWPGQVVGRETLLAAVWPGVVVGDDSLTQVVIKLRKALGDDADKPAYIQTISKRGYRLIAAVEAAVPASAGRSVPRAAVAGVGALVLAVAGAAFWWRMDTLSGSAAVDHGEVARAQAALAAQPVVGIRPFEALGSDPQAALLARGITADLVTDLSKVSGLSVTEGVPAEETMHDGMQGGRPAARYVVAGSVQRAGQRVRLHVYLSDARTGQTLWSERFDRALSGLFEVQAELGPRLLQLLPGKLTEAELWRVARRHTRNLGAYENFLHAQSALLIRERGSNEHARELFRRAIDLDATFARAYAGLALTYCADYRNQWTNGGRAALERALELARTAHQINPDIAETYWVLAFVHLERRQHEQALRYLESAVRLYPSFADAYALMGGIHTYIGRPADTVPLLRTAMRLNPQANYLHYLLLGRAYLFLGDMEQARINLEQALLRNPANLESHIYMAARHMMAGNKAAAVQEADEIRALQPGFTIQGWLETDPTTDAGQRNTLARVLGELGY